MKVSVVVVGSFLFFLMAGRIIVVADLSLETKSCFLCTLMEKGQGVLVSASYGLLLRAGTDNCVGKRNKERQGAPGLTDMFSLCAKDEN